MSIDNQDRALGPGDRIVIRTPDRREFRGVLVEFRGEGAAVVRLDTGWVTTYPVSLIFPDAPRPGHESGRS